MDAMFHLKLQISLIDKPYIMWLEMTICHLPVPYEMSLKVFNCRHCAASDDGEEKLWEKI